MTRQLTVDFNRLVAGDLVRANARHAVPGTEIRVGARLVVGDDDWGIGEAEVVEYDPVTCALVLRVLGELRPEVSQAVPGAAGST